MTLAKNSARTAKHKRQDSAVDNVAEKKAIGWPQVETRAWAASQKNQRGAMKMSATRKIPSGPVGGNGRKTNLARSS
ncbi:MAG: hypothetical protein EOO28_33155 [Comamonadaceae bacterium]|nr:MAG: hypothetical protein EOO28_33155 [Comamonadaceae bacterium]